MRRKGGGGVRSRGGGSEEYKGGSVFYITCLVCQILPSCLIVERQRVLFHHVYVH